MRGGRQGCRPSQRRYAGWLQTTAGVALFTFTACSGTATITRRNGPDYEGTIEDSDSESVYVRAGNGAVYRVPRRDIVDIDHPGNVHLTIGASLLLLGTLMLVDPVQSNADWSFGSAPAVVLAIAGAVLAVGGGVIYGSSILSANSSKAPAPARLVLLPAAKQPLVPTSVLSAPVQKPALTSDAVPTPAPYQTQSPPR